MKQNVRDEFYRRFMEAYKEKKAKNDKDFAKYIKRNFEEIGKFLFLHLVIEQQLLRYINLVCPNIGPIEDNIARSFGAKLNLAVGLKNAPPFFNPHLQILRGINKIRNDLSHDITISRISPAKLTQVKQYLKGKLFGQKRYNGPISLLTRYAIQLKLELDCLEAAQELLQQATEELNQAQVDALEAHSKFTQSQSGSILR